MARKLTMNSDHWSDASPKPWAFSTSLITPAAVGPRPRPMMFRIKNRTALEIARKFGGARVWVRASAGPRYIAAKNTVSDQHASDA